MAKKLGEAHYIYLDQPGSRVTLEISAFAGWFRCEVRINDAPARSARRKTLAGALRWGLDCAEWQAELLGFSSPPPALESVFDSVEALLAA